MANTINLLDFQMDTELQQFNTERAERIRQLNDKHEKELEAFDDESTRMGFRYILNGKFL